MEDTSQSPVHQFKPGDYVRPHRASNNINALREKGISLGMVFRIQDVSRHSLKIHAPFGDAFWVYHTRVAALTPLESLAMEAECKSTF